MSLNIRQEHIVEMLNTRESVDVEDLSGAFSVSSQTIRNDLRLLADMGLVTRIHGGARRLTTLQSREYSDRRKLRETEKAAMGSLTAGLIPDDCSVTLNIGTSTEQVARALTGHSGLMVISNNINIVNILMGSGLRELVLVGGTVRPADGAIVGQDAVDFISRYKVDYAVIGASALDEDGDILDYDAREVSVARAILKNARTRILVCDGSKFERTAPVRICGIGELDYMVTDGPPPPAFARAAETGGTVILKPGDEDVIAR